MGIRSPVRLAAWMPAIRATSRGLPLGFLGRARSTAGDSSTKAEAAAVRRVVSFVLTSTMPAWPAELKCDSFAISFLLVKQKRGGLAGGEHFGSVRHHQKAVGARKSRQVAGALPADSFNLRLLARRAAEGAHGRHEAGETRLAFALPLDASQRKSRPQVGASAERGQHRDGEEKKCRRRRDRISGQAEKDLACLLPAADAGQLAKNRWLAGLDAYAGEMKRCAGATQGFLDQIEFAGGNAA